MKAAKTSEGARLTPNAITLVTWSQFISRIICAPPKDAQNSRPKSSAEFQNLFEKGLRTIVAQHSGDLKPDPIRSVPAGYSESMPLAGKAPDSVDAEGLLSSSSPCGECREAGHEKGASRGAAWPGTHVANGALKAQIKELREAMGDDAASPRFIETQHRVGYRFIGKVSGKRVRAAFSFLDSAACGAAGGAGGTEARGGTAGDQRLGDGGDWTSPLRGVGPA